MFTLLDFAMPSFQSFLTHLEPVYRPDIRFRRVKFLFLLLTLFCQDPANGQPATNPYPAKLDSLQTLLKIQPKADSMRVIRLNAIAQLCYFDMQFERGLKAAKEARALAKQIAYPTGEGLYLQTLNVLSDKAAIGYYYDAKVGWFFADWNMRRPLNEIPSPENIDFEKKNIRLRAFLKTLDEKHDAEIIGIVLRIICANYRELDQYDESRSYLNRSVNTFLRANMPEPAYYILAFEIAGLVRTGKEKEAAVIEQQLTRFLATRKPSRETSLITWEMSNVYVGLNKPTKIFALLIKTEAYLEQIHEEEIRPYVLLSIGSIYITLGLPGKALGYFKKQASIYEKQQIIEYNPWIYNKIAFTLIRLNRFHEAEAYINKARKFTDKLSDSRDKKTNLAQHYDAVGQVLMGQKKEKEALPNFHKAIELAKELGFKSLVFYMNLYIAQCHQRLGNINESNRYGLESYDIASKTNNSDGREVSLKSSRLIYENYDKLNQPLLAYRYLQANDSLKKNLDAERATNQLADVEISTIVQKNEQEKSRLENARLLKEKENQNQRWWLFTAAAGLVSAIILLVIVSRNNRHKQKANALLHKQKEEIERQRTKAENALTELTATQAQLIQKEKLASLGELTAGIAHEIQNPLNFVNNFSEVSSELIVELKEEVLAGRTEEILAITDDLAENLQKINHHGGRASSIVKGMLEHSRSGHGEQLPTNLNVLAEEYLRLAYHGQISKSKEFVCRLETDFDPDLGEVNVVPQEIGRVLLNLYNNAFYAVLVRQRQEPDNYQPTIWISTKLISKQVEIRVKDNGVGVSESIITKIFQPFFTTKPTGDGTGLGLSLSYDIITKGHFGSLTVASTEGEGSEFTIHLPIHK